MAAARSEHEAAQGIARASFEAEDDLAAAAAATAAAERSAAVDARVAAARAAVENAREAAGDEAERRKAAHAAAQEAYAAELVAYERAKTPDNDADTAFIEERVAAARDAATARHAELMAVYEAAKSEHEKRMTTKGAEQESEVAAARAEVAVRRAKHASDAGADAAAHAALVSDAEAAAAAAEQRAKHARSAAVQARTWAEQARARVAVGDGSNRRETLQREKLRRRWTDESGQPSHMPDPSDRSRGRSPFIYDPEAPYLACEPTRVLFDTGADVSARAYQLDVELGRVDLHDHSLMAREEVLAAALDTSVGVYERRAGAGMAEFRSQQADALSAALDKANAEIERLGGFDAVRAAAAAAQGADAPAPAANAGGTAGEGLRCAALLERKERLDVEVADAAEMRDAEEAEDLQHVRHIQSLFAELQEVRRVQGFAATTASVRFTHRPGDPKRDAERERLAVAGQVRQMAARHTKVQADARKEHALAMSAANEHLRLARAKAEEGARMRREAAAKPGAPAEATETERDQAEADLAAVAAAEAQLEKVGAMAPKEVAFDTDAAAEAVVAARRAAGTETKVGAPRVVPMRATTPRHEPVIPPQETQRRRRLAAMRVYAKVFIDGREAGITPPAAPAGITAMSFELGTLLSLQVRACPHELRVDIYEKAFPSDKVLASLYLAVPGTNGAPLVYERPGTFEFTGDEAFSSPWDIAQGGGLREGATMRYPHGSLQARMAWTGEVDVGTGAATSGVLAVEGTAKPGESSSTAADGGASGSFDVEAAGARGDVGDRAPPPVAAVEVDAHVIVHGRSTAARASHSQGHTRRHAPFASVGALSEPRLVEWIEGSKRALDPNDPRNSHIVELLHGKMGNTVTAREAAAAAGVRPPGYRLGADDAAALEAGVLGPRARLLRVRWDRAVRLDLEVPLRDNDLHPQQLEVLEQAEGRGGGDAQRMRHQPDKSALSDAASDAAMKLRESARLALRDRLAAALPAAAVRGGVPLAGGIGSGPASAALRARLRPAARVEDVVKDTPLPEFGLNLQWLSEIFRPRRKLKPTVTTEVVRTTHPDVCQISIYVSKAYNIPLRVGDAQSVFGRFNQTGAGGVGAAAAGAFSPSATMRTSSFSPSATMRTSSGLDDALLGDPVLDGANGGGATRASTFVEVTFQGRTVRTRSVDGGAPVWSEQLVLPFSPPQGGSAPSVLHAMKEPLIISLYDEVPDASGAVDAAGCFRTMRRYLGRQVTPIGEVCRAGQLRGPIRLAAPSALLGYRRQRGGGAAGDMPLLYVSLALQPQLTPEIFEVADETTSMSEFTLGQGVTGDVGISAAPTVEDALLLQQARAWEADCKRLSVPARAIVRDAEGAAVVACRYISSLRPPPSLGLPDDGAVGEQGMQMMLRFVSLYPDPPEWLYTFRADRMWMRHAEVAECSMAGGVERALMLCSLFRWAGVEAYVLSDAVGVEPSHVITMSGVAGADAPRRIWCPGSVHCDGDGTAYDVSDVSCEVRSVGTLLGPANAYANVQAVKAPWEVTWDLWDARLWHAMLPRVSRGVASTPAATSREAALATVQAQPTFAPVGMLSMRAIEEALERRVMDSLSSARTLTYTHFNRRLSKELKPLLQELEQLRASGESFASGGAAMGGDSLGAELAHEKALESFTRTYRFTGYPLLVPLSSVEEACQRVLATGIHLDTSQGNEFAVATLVAPAGAGAVAAAWIYVALLVRK